MGRKEKKTQDKMRSLLAYVCWYDVRTQTSVVIPVSTDLNLYAHTHSPISRREDRLHLYADGFLETIPSLTSSFLPSSSVIHYTSPKLNLKCQKAFFLSLLILPFSQPYPPIHPLPFNFLPSPNCSLSPSIPSVLCLVLHRWLEQLSKARGGRRKGSVYPKQHIRTDTHS